MAHPLSVAQIAIQSKPSIFHHPVEALHLPPSSRSPPSSAIHEEHRFCIILQPVEDQSDEEALSDEEEHSSKQISLVVVCPFLPPSK
ncbi:unnamed protein product [Ilex paraguariensis]|uniref:Uncharacterized protein n=1 Tax=Ilex paraguariensis TaxID=185542 RepID=A0ABC8RQ12_9AQUA